MNIHEAVFLKSSVSFRDCPEPSLPEYAFIGRSNVGKSSLINMITGYGKLAKISGTPGKTRLINHFLVNGNWYLADLPGYGFARVAKSVRMKWEAMIRDYLTKRANLINAFLLIDIRHDPLKNDLAFISWLGSQQIPFTLVFTKSDKLGVNLVQSKLANYRKILSGTWEPLPNIIVSSSNSGLGRSEILATIKNNSAGLKHD